MNALVKTPDGAGAVAPLAELDLYRVFAVCFGQPSGERYSWLSGKEFRRLLKHLAGELKDGAVAGAARRFPSYAEYEAAYLALFEVGVPAPPVPLLESAHSRRAVPQEIVLDCVNFYEVLGLRSSGSAYPPDHLLTQLEFLAAVRYLRESKTNTEEVATLVRLEADFLERHLLNWLPAARKKLSKFDPPMFLPLLSLLCEHIRREHEVLQGQVPARAISTDASKH